LRALRIHGRPLQGLRLTVNPGRDYRLQNGAHCSSSIELDDLGRVLVQGMFGDPDSEPWSTKHRSATAETEPDRIAAHVFGQQHRSKRAFGEVHLLKSRGKVASGRRQNCGLPNLAANLDSNSRAGSEPCDPGRSGYPSAFRNTDVQVVDRFG